IIVGACDRHVLSQVNGDEEGPDAVPADGGALRPEATTRRVTPIRQLRAVLGRGGKGVVRVGREGIGAVKSDGLQRARALFAGAVKEQSCRKQADRYKGGYPKDRCHVTLLPHR